MYRSVRVSRKAVLDVLTDKLANALAYDIYNEICRIDEEDAMNMVGMTVEEWRDRFDDDCRIVWADDTRAGFGKAGDSVYGDCRDCVIVRISEQGATCAPRYTLHVWCEGLSTDDKGINSVMKRYMERTHQEEVRG